MKVFRYLVLKEGADQPSCACWPARATVTAAAAGRAPISSGDVIDSVITFHSCCFFLTLAVSAVVLSLTGLETQTAITAAWTAVANIGPGLWPPRSAPPARWRRFPTPAKWIMIFCMLVGRLELLAVFVLFTTAFWRG